MIFWSAPLQPRVIFDRLHLHPWGVMLSGYFVARCSTEKEAEEIATKLRAAVPECRAMIRQAPKKAFRPKPRKMRKRATS